jgi:hypothetical protein
MRRLDWFLAAVIGAFLVAGIAAQALSQAVVGVMAGAPDARGRFVERLLNPHADPISVEYPSLLLRRR